MQENSAIKALSLCYFQRTYINFIENRIESSMNFGALLYYAKRKSDEAKEQQQDGKFYSTKFSPPKKVKKENKPLSNNIQKFLNKKEAEEAKKPHKKNPKMTESQDKQKTINSRGIITTTTTTTGPGHNPGEGQGDDYGFTSTEANVLYEKYLEKVEHVQENKDFAPSRPQPLVDISGTINRVKAAIDRDLQEAEIQKRPKGRPGTTKAATIRIDAKIQHNSETEKGEKEKEKRLSRDKRKRGEKEKDPGRLISKELWRHQEKHLKRDKKHEPKLSQGTDTVKRPTFISKSSSSHSSDSFSSNNQDPKLSISSNDIKAVDSMGSPNGEEKQKEKPNFSGSSSNESMEI
ncbi:protein SPT2 homolog isoform X2 [Drosophila kikkawai]|uniref:Protein SPT2 homolog isoform X2 n=1 Tax=Drosophila kikkawai TaxID=30033 RepID=A0A6P4JEQ0_DROKI